MSKLPTRISHFWYKICMRSDGILSLVCFLKFSANLKYALYYALKSCKNIKLQKNAQSCTDLILEVWYASWKLWHQSLCSKNIWVPQWYPYYYETLLIHLYFSMDHISMERTNVTSQLNVVPQWYPKNIFRKIYTLSFLTPCQSYV